MRAARIHRFGGPETIVIEEAPRPEPGPGQVVVRVANAGVGPWDAWIREHKSVVKVSLPVTLGSDLSGVIEAVGSGVTEFRPGDEVYGVTNPEFVGAYAEFALCSAGMIARKPRSLSFREAASAPVVAVTAWQMLFDYGGAKPGCAVLIHGAAGNVGAYAVQLASQAGLEVFATAAAGDVAAVQSAGAAMVLDYRATRFEESLPMVDIALDTVGGETRRRSMGLIKPGGILISIVGEPLPSRDEFPGIRTVFFLAEVTTARLDNLTRLFDAGKLRAQVGEALALDQVRDAHRMLAGAPHKRGKIVLDVAQLTQA